MHEHIKNKARLTAVEITEMRKFVRKGIYKTILFTSFGGELKGWPNKRNTFLEIPISTSKKLKNNGKQYTTSKKRKPV